ncbi:hypothetical protein DFJ74DRAFT_767219 [Hyaloraphidium curvatum]|nr:hypothetical protein DFJ74DRAFT_767219 [Hyaloraphidium curvatum]
MSATRRRGGGSRTIARGGEQQTQTAVQVQTPATASDERVYLDVPFEEKDLAKRRGAKWDPERRQWYVPAGVDPARLEHWFPGGRGRSLRDGDAADTNQGGGSSRGRGGGRGGRGRGTNTEGQRAPTRRGGSSGGGSNVHGFSSRGPRPLFPSSSGSGRPVDDAEALRNARLARFGGQQVQQEVRGDAEMQDGWGSDEEDDLSDDGMPAPAPRGNPSPPSARRPARAEAEDDSDEELSDGVLAPRLPRGQHPSPSSKAADSKGKGKGKAEEAIEVDEGSDSDLSESALAPRPRRR